MKCKTEHVMFDVFSFMILKLDKISPAANELQLMNWQACGLVQGGTE
jgi:hypothetical protein